MKTNKQSENQSLRKRAWKSEILPYVFTVRASWEEGNKLKEMAAETGWSLSRLMIESTLRNGIGSASEAQALEAERRALLEEMMFEIRKIGINVSRTSHVINAAYRGAGEPPEQKEIEAVLREIKSVFRDLKTKL